MCELAALDAPVLIMSEVIIDEENTVDSVDIPEDKHKQAVTKLRKATR